MDYNVDSPAAHARYVDISDTLEFVSDFGSSGKNTISPPKVMFWHAVWCFCGIHYHNCGSVGNAAVHVPASSS